MASLVAIEVTVLVVWVLVAVGLVVATVATTLWSDWWVDDRDDRVDSPWPGMDDWVDSMGKGAVHKGKQGEREVAAAIREHTGWNVQRRCRQHDSDSDLLGVDGWCIEVKRRAAASRGDLREWWDQAVAQAGETSEAPVLLYRRDRDEWRAVWMLRPMWVYTGLGYEWTVETSLAAWCMYARHPDGTYDWSIKAAEATKEG